MAKQSWWRRLVDGREPVFPEDEPAPPTEHEPTLEAEILRDLEAVEPYQIYADWLYDRGDPRGALMALQAACEARVDENRWDPRVRTLDPWTVLAGEAAKAAQELVARFPTRLGGDLEPGDHVEWHCGYWKRLHVEPAPVANTTQPFEVRLAAVLHQESARFLRTLSIGAVPDWPIAERLPALPDTLRALHLGAVSNGALGELDWIEALWPRVQKLDTIVLQGRNLSLFTAFKAPKLRSLEVVTDDLERRTFHAIVHSELPALESLILWLGGRGRSNLNRDDIRGLANASLPSLRELGLVKCQIADDALEVIIDAPWFPQLRVLDLSRGTLTKRGVATLERVRDRLPELAYLDVSRNTLDSDACTRARALAPKVRTIEQHG